MKNFIGLTRASSDGLIIKPVNLNFHQTVGSLEVTDLLKQPYNFGFDSIVAGPRGMPKRSVKFFQLIVRF